MANSFLIQKRIVSLRCRNQKDNIMELLSKEAKERMEGLTSGMNNQDFEYSVYRMIKDLTDEGFEEEEVKAWLIERIKNL